jgi:peroxin-5
VRPAPRTSAPPLTPGAEENNPHLAGPPRTLLADAKALLASGGSLTEAARLLEAALQRGDAGTGGYEAWLLLGEARSMDERERPAMQALAEGVRAAEQNGAAGAGMLTLAISYTNEAYDRGANALLLRWLRARYPDHPVPAARPRSHPCPQRRSRARARARGTARRS